MDPCLALRPVPVVVLAEREHNKLYYTLHCTGRGLLCPSVTHHKHKTQKHNDRSPDPADGAHHCWMAGLLPTLSVNRCWRPGCGSWPVTCCGCGSCSCSCSWPQVRRSGCGSWTCAQGGGVQRFNTPIYIELLVTVTWGGSVAVEVHAQSHVTPPCLRPPLPIPLPTPCLTDGASPSPPPHPTSLYPGPTLTCSCSCSCSASATWTATWTWSVSETSTSPWTAACPPSPGSRPRQTGSGTLSGPACGWRSPCRHTWRSRPGPASHAHRA